jgi:hypothetical protein
MAIALIASTPVTGTSITTAALNVTFGATIAAGSDIVVTANTNGSGTNGTVIDTQGNTYVQEVLGTSTNVEQTEVFVCHNSAHTVTTSDHITYTNASASRKSVSMEGLSGVVAIGITGTSSGASGTRTISIVTPDANDWVAGGFCSAGTTSYTASTGNLRTQGSSSTTLVGCLMDNTAASAGSVIIAATGPTGIWSAAVVVLRSTTGATPNWYGWKVTSTPNW